MSTSADRGGALPAAKPVLRLNSLINSRKSLARLLRMRAQGEIDREVFRDLCYGFEKFIQILRLEKDVSIEEELAQLRADIDALKLGRK